MLQVRDNMQSAVVGVLALGCSALANSQEHNHESPQQDAHQHHEMTATQSTHVHHMHSEGMWMFEYNFMRMNMKDLMSGTTSVTAERALDNGRYVNPNGDTYQMLPSEMTMDMHMLMAMYSFTDRLSAMVMLNYLDNDMDMIMAGMTMGMTSSGLGDTEIGLMYSFDTQSEWNVVGSLNVSLPTGSIDEKGDSMGTEVVLPYDMQLGSGTFDLKPSVTASLKRGKFEWGGQGTYTLRLGDNDQDYNLGDRFELVGYGKYAVNNGVSLRGALTYLDWSSIEGSDKRITDLRTSDNVPTNYGGTRLDASLGVMLTFGAHTVGAEGAIPVMQDLNGLQMETENTISLSYSFMFM